MLLAGIVEFAEVQFYFFGEINGERHSLALISLFSRPDQELFERSSWTLWSVTQLPHDCGLRVVQAKAIQAVVAIIPFTVRQGTTAAGSQEGRHFIWEQLGLDIALWSETLTNADDEADEEDEGAEDDSIYV